MVPLLKATSDGEARPLRDLRQTLARSFDLTDAEMAERLQNGQPLFANRIAWAATHLEKAGAVERVRRGVIRITDRGRKLLADHPDRITLKALVEFPEYREFRNMDEPRITGDGSTTDDPGTLQTLTPEERLAESYGALRNALAADLLESVKKSTPAFFEKLVVDLLVAMGYGGSIEDAGRAVGGVGDDGIHGIIKEDKLGLDVVYIQAKRWANPVGRPVVQAFAGSLEGQRARKGVLITTSDFSQDAREYVQRIEKKIVLIDGPQLAQYMIDYSVGVRTERSYVVKRLNSDYFDEG